MTFLRRTALHQSLRSALLACGLCSTVALLGASEADAVCSKKTGKGCKTQPWMTGKAETPIGEKWWPHPIWGAGDEAGSTNWYKKPEVVARAVAEADKGKVYNLGRPYDDNMPMFGNRKFALRIPGAPTGGPIGGNQVVHHEDFLATEFGQVGTQFDALGHPGVQTGKGADPSTMRFYNGFTGTEVSSSSGLKKLGVEKAHPIVARGILLDIAGAKGVEMLEAGYEIKMADVRAALKRQGMEGFKFLPGDGVFFHTGWGKLWGKDNAKFSSGGPGIGMEVARWLSDKVKVGIFGADTWATEVVPSPHAGCVFCVHTHMLTRHGIVNQENMRFDDLLADKVYKFMYVYSPTPVVGASGSMGAPIAID